MKKESQYIKVLRIVNAEKNQKTFDINRLGLDAFITDASRHLRRLAEDGLIKGEIVKGKNYKKWNITAAGKKFLRTLK